eukprot:COSAG01_NODE_55213_length_326_cov_4.066079_1_plen_76_part_01
MKNWICQQEDMAGMAVAENRSLHVLLLTGRAAMLRMLLLCSCCAPGRRVNQPSRPLPDAHSQWQTCRRLKTRRGRG